MKLLLLSIFLCAQVSGRVKSAGLTRKQKAVLFRRINKHLEKGNPQDSIPEFIKKEGQLLTKEVTEIVQQVIRNRLRTRPNPEERVWLPLPTTLPPKPLETTIDPKTSVVYYEYNASEAFADQRFFNFKPSVQPEEPTTSSPILSLFFADAEEPQPDEYMNIERVTSQIESEFDDITEAPTEIPTSKTTSFNTRPEWMEVFPILRELKKIFTDANYDAIMDNRLSRANPAQEISIEKFEQIEKFEKEIGSSDFEEWDSEESLVEECEKLINSEVGKEIYAIVDQLTSEKDLLLRIMELR
ncbi:Oidioi.mRNA.OKI2018_I69.PAR.g9522.t1.cds [Oikopleura dioica]|uniref:Oidioi.mRNA.OKI2018_I69.PAR.g9522.t1.cds n=1 Tax=Oikopleura dioica TaxID=34765 RepID=A0ABN7RNW5_OIKDI|nr:Oidioi.mRNA.OKI2018_I69.PAR.g9522.t1.cds [Oikopleura dioica]